MLTPTESQRLLEQVVSQVNAAFEKDRKKFSRLEDRVKQLETALETALEASLKKEPRSTRKTDG